MSVLREIQPSYRAVYYVPTALIKPRPYPMRDQYDQEKLLALAASIRQYGLLQPVTVRWTGDGYEIVLGERRLQACVMLGFSYIDAFVLQAAERETALYSLLENTCREPLHFFDLAASCASLEESGMPAEAIGQQLSAGTEWVEKLRSLLQLPPEVRRYIREAGLTARHASALLPLMDSKKQMSIAQRSARLRLSPRATEALVEKDLDPAAQPKRKIISVIREPRLYVNAIHSIVEKMRAAGMDARTDTSEDDSWITVNIKIRKRK